MTTIELINKTIEQIPTIYKGKMKIYLSSKKYAELCSELKRDVKTYKGFKIVKSLEQSNNNVTFI